MTDTEYAGRHRKLSAADFHISRIAAKYVHTTTLADGTLYVSLADATTGNHLGVGFGPDAITALRDALTNPSNLPDAIDVHRCAGGFHNGELFLTILADTGRVSTFAIAGEALDQLRDALADAADLA